MSNLTKTIMNLTKAPLMIGTLATAMIVTASPAIAKAKTNDHFTAITEGEAVLNMVSDEGDICEFIITNEKTAVEHISQKITALYGEEPVVRGSTRAWSLKNKNNRSNQADHVSILIIQSKDGQYRLKMDRRKGESRNNSRRTRTARQARRTVARTPQAPRRTPPPATKD